MTAPTQKQSSIAAAPASFSDFLKTDPAGAGFALLAFLCPWLAFLSPRGTGALIPIMAVLILGAHFWRNRELGPLRSASWLFVIAALLLTGASSLWAPNADFALERLSKLALFIPLGTALVLIASPDKARNSWIAKALTTGTLIALLLLALHVATRGGIYALLNPDEIAAIKLNASNKPATVMLLLTGAVFLAWRGFNLTRTAWLYIGVLFVIFALSPSQSTAAGVLVWLVAYGIAATLPRFALHLTSFGGALLILAMPFLFVGLSILDANRSLDWDAASVGARLDIWYAVSYKILGSPLYGYGVEAARFITDWSTDLAYLTRAKFHHPHNGILQIWLEFGLIGAGLAAGAWALLTKKIARFDPRHRPAMIASFAAFFFVLCITYGLWQSWWICIMAGAIALTRLVATNGSAQEGEAE